MDQLYNFGHNFGIFGKPGTGKTTKLIEIIYLALKQKKQIAVTTPTGLASTNFIHLQTNNQNSLKISTIDSFFHTEDGRFQPEEQLQYIRAAHPQSITTYTNLNLLIIDEIGLVSEQKLTMVSIIISHIKKSEKNINL